MHLRCFLRSFRRGHNYSFLVCDRLTRFPAHSRDTLEFVSNFTDFETGAYTGKTNSIHFQSLLSFITQQPFFHTRDVKSINVEDEQVQKYL